MKKIFTFIMSKRWFIVLLFLSATAISLLRLQDVVINDDLSAYLPDNSNTKQAVIVSEEEFGVNSSLKVMFEGLTSTETESLYSELLQIDDVVQIHTQYYTEDESTVLFELIIADYSTSDTAKSLLNEIESSYPEAVVGGDIYTSNQPLVPSYIIIVAFIILMILLFLFTSSWIEPFLFMFTIGIALIINSGTNVLLDSVSNITFSIAALLQLVLSIDYSIILLNRYRQEKEKETNNKNAMIQALTNSFPSIFGSSFTTIIGLLCLVPMSFKIGEDLGIVLAKGVFISLLVVIFVLPTVILLFDKLIEKTQKKSLRPKLLALSHLSYKGKIVIPILLVALLLGSTMLRGTTNVTFEAPDTVVDQTTEYFPNKNLFVILYEHEDELQIPNLIGNLSQDEHVLKISAYATTIGAPLDATQLSALTGMDENSINMLLMSVQQTEMTITDFITLVTTNFMSMLTPEQLGQLASSESLLNESASQFVGPNYSRVILTTDYQSNQDNTKVFVDDLYKTLDDTLTGKYYVMGESVMASEIESGFDSEYLFITLITIVAIFLIVAITFRSFLIPGILVVIIQTAIFITIGVLGLVSEEVYFLNLFIVQAILMGATIDYGILFASYFRENSQSYTLKQRLENAYEGASHTILTSASILFLVTGLLGFISTDQTIKEVLQALAVGTFVSTLLILFALPATLALTHKFINKK